MSFPLCHSQGALAGGPPNITVAHTQSAGADATIWDSSSFSSSGKTIVVVLAMFKIAQTPTVPTVVVDHSGAADSMTLLSEEVRTDGGDQQQSVSIFGIDRALSSESVRLTFPGGDFNLLHVVALSVANVSTVESVSDTDVDTNNGTTPCTLSNLNSGALVVVAAVGEAGGDCTQDELTTLNSGSLSVMDYDVAWGVDYDGTNVQFDLAGSIRTCAACGASWSTV